MSQQAQIFLRAFDTFERGVKFIPQDLTSVRRVASVVA
jgi:hypothetical protein